MRDMPRALFGKRAGAVFAIVFCALSWLAVGDSAFRLAHAGRGPGFGHLGYVLADLSIKRLRALT